MGYSDELWDGFDPVSKQVNETSEFFEDIAKYVQKFSSISSTYAKGLQSLSKTKLSVPPENSYSSLGNTWQILLETAEKLNGVFTAFASDLDQVNESILKSEKEKKKQRKLLNTQGQKMVAELAKSESAASKAKQKFQGCKKKQLESLEEYNKAKDSQTANVVAKLGKKADADTKNAEKADKELHKGIEILRACQEKVFLDEMPKLLQELQNFEEERIDKMRAELIRVAEAQQNLVPGITASCETLTRTVQAINAKSDTGLFIEKHKTNRKLDLATYETYQFESVSPQNYSSPPTSGNSTPKSRSVASSVTVTPIPTLRGSAQKEKVVAIYDYDATDENELSFKAKNIITVVQKDDSGWWQGEYNGKVGMFPSNFVKSPDEQNASSPSAEVATEEPAAEYKQYKALYDYTAQDEEELSFSEGDIFSLESEEEGWLFVYDSNGSYGRIPSTYCEPV